MEARIEQVEEAFFPLSFCWIGREYGEGRERVLCCEASFGSLRNLWPKFVQKSTKNSVARGCRTTVFSLVCYTCALNLQCNSFNTIIHS